MEAVKNRSTDLCKAGWCAAAAAVAAGSSDHTPTLTLFWSNTTRKETFLFFAT